MNPNPAGDGLAALQRNLHVGVEERSLHTDPLERLSLNQPETATIKYICYFTEEDLRSAKNACSGTRAAVVLLFDTAPESRGETLLEPTRGFTLAFAQGRSTCIARSGETPPVQNELSQGVDCTRTGSLLK